MLSSKIYPSSILDSNKTYVFGLIDFVTFNTKPNVDDTNSKFHFDGKVTIPQGSYEISDIEKFIYIMESLKEKSRPS